MKLLRVIWDLFLTEFAGRTEAHERNFAGGYEANRVETYQAAEHSGLNASMKAMVDECMSPYDLDGWTHPTWANVPWSLPDAELGSFVGWVEAHAYSSLRARSHQLPLR